MKPAKYRGVLVILPAVVALMGGCLGGSEEGETATSGDPESNQRAEMRVGTEGDKGKDGKGDEARTLYERLGGERGITAIVDDMVTRSIADPRVNFERREVRRTLLGRKYKPWEPTPENINQLKHHMVEFLTVATGGPAEYTGREMGEAHKGMQISNSEFDAMVGDIKTSMDKLGVGTKEKKDLIAIIETTRKQIVEKK